MNIDNLSVVQFIESGGPGGAESLVLRLSLALRERGVRVAVATLRSGWLTEQLHDNHVAHYLIDSPSRLDVSLPFRLAGHIKDFGAQVLHSHLLDSNFYGSLAAKLARVPHLATEHGDLHHTSPKSWAGVKMRTASLLGSQFSAVSEFGRSKLIKAGVPAKQTCCIYNPVDLPQRDEMLRKERRAALQIPADPEAHWLWIHVANIRPVKDQQLLIKSFARARKLSTIDSSLVIIGDGAGRADLETLSCELGIKRFVHFLGFRTDVSAWLQAADGFLLSSKSESMPLALLEAAAHSLVIVATNVGGVAELVQDKSSGLLVEPGDEIGFAEAISYVLTNHEHASLMAEKAFRTCRQRFSIESILSQYIEIYAGEGAGSAISSSGILPPNVLKK